MFKLFQREKGFYRRLFALALPILLQNLITNSLGLVDTFMVGTMGQGPLAGVTLANIPVFVVQLMMFGIQSGSSVLISQYRGKGDMKAINRVMGIGMYAAGFIGLVFALIMGFLPHQFMSLFGSDAQVIATAARYARIVGWSYFFDSFVQVYNGVHRAMGNPKRGLYILGVSMACNTFLNWVFIFGNLGAPALGVVGAAVATLSARVLEFVIMLSYALTNRRFRLKPAVLFRPGRALLAKFLHYSGPVVLNETLWGLGTSLYKVIMGHMEGSTEILAARALAGNIEDLCTVAIFAIGNTTAIIVGREIGAGRREHVYEVGATLDTLAFLCGLIIGIPLILGAWFVFPWLVYPFFHLSETAGSITTMMLTFIGVFLALRAFDSVNTVGVLRGGGDVRAATIIDTTPLWFVSLPLAALFGLVFQWGIFWVYVGIMAEQFVKFGIGLYRLRSREWINDVTQFSTQEKEAAP